MDVAKATELLKAGSIIVVRAKNGTCEPLFIRKPGAYRCKIGDTSIAPSVVHALIKRRVIEPVKTGWYSEGNFQFNRNLRDHRGRFRKSH